jgi:hypothetical protein
MRTYAVCFIFLPLLSWRTSGAQQNILKPDQNPRYTESAQYYRLSAQTLPNTEGVTLQQTYKAFDWYEARQERRLQRHQRRLDQYSHHSLIYYNKFPGRYYRGTPFPRGFPRHRFFKDTFPYH